MSRRLASLLPTLMLAGPLAAQIPQREYQQRRDSLAARVEAGVILALGAPESAEDYFPFAQSSNFLYLTGFNEPNAALVMVKRGGTVAATMFVQPNDPAQEVWTGARLGTAGVTNLTGMAARTFDALRPTLDSLLALDVALHVVGAGGEGERAHLTPDEQFVQALRERHPRLRVVDASPTVLRQRGRKSAAELALIRRAGEITVAAQQEAIRAIDTTVNEFEIEALIEFTFRRRGADRPAFESIVGSGPNSTTLHYNRNDRFVQPGDVVVMDVGASVLGYAADVTRTVPVRGTFSAEQRAIYQLVRDAQAAAERQARPGARAQLMSDSATAVIQAGLARLGLIEAVGATYDCGEGGTSRCQQYQLYYMHGLGHGIGLEVHDPDQFYFTGVLATGSAFTIEPGVYVRPNLLDILPDTPRNRALIAKIRPAVERYRSIGVRIEDDYVISEQGLEWISRAPREIAEVEALMRERDTGPAKRDRSLVEWYRAARP